MLPEAINEGIFWIDPDRKASAVSTEHSYSDKGLAGQDPSHGH